MRIWSVHPKHLDAKGLVALWRETLLAQHVLEGKTKGYRNHPQLERFKKLKNPVDGINHYLAEVHKEAERRGYSFDRSKIDWSFRKVKMTVKDKQFAYECAHLERKLKTRDPEKLKENRKEKKILPHPIFRIVPGAIESWEIV